MASLMAILVKRSHAFPQGSSIVANFEQTYCQPQVEALNRAPHHVDPRLCGGTCIPRPVTNGRYTIQVNTTEYSIHNVQVDIRATRGANIMGFAVVAVSEKNVTAGRWVIQEVQNPTVVRATCDALLQGQVIFHARASRDRSRVTVTWDSRRTNFGRIFFRAWIVQRHSEIFVLDSEPLTNRLNASAFASLESKFTDILSGISLPQSAPPGGRQQSDSALVNSTTQPPATTSVTQNSAPSPTSTAGTQNSTLTSSVTEQPEISTPFITSTSATQNSTQITTSTSAIQNSTQISTSTSATQNSTQITTSTSATQHSTTSSSTSLTEHLEISTPSPTSTSMTEQAESLSLNSTAPTSTFSNITSPTNITKTSQVQPGSHKTNHTSSSSRKDNSNITNADTAGIPSLTSLKDFEAAFSARLSNGYKINDKDPFGEFNRASYQLTDFIPESKARRFTNTSLDPFRTELVFETNGPNLSRDLQSTNRPSSVHVPDQTVGQGQLPGRMSGSLLEQNLGSPAGQLQEGHQLLQGLVPGQLQGQVPWQQRPFSGGFPIQPPFQQQGQFPIQPPFQQQGQFPGQSQQQGQLPGQTQQQGQFPGQLPFQQWGQLPGQSQQQGQFPGQSQQQGQFPGQSQQQGQFPGQPPFQQHGQFPGQSQQQGQFPGQSQQQGQFPGQSQQQGQFPGQLPFQQQGQFPGQLPFQQQGQFPGQLPFQQQGQLPGQLPFQQQGQFPGQSQQQGQFPGQSQQQGQFPGQSQQQGQFPGQSQQQGQLPRQLPFQQWGQFPGQQALQQMGQFPSQFPWVQQGQLPNQADGRSNNDNLGFSSTFSGTPLMPNIATNNPGSNGLNNFQNQAQSRSGPSGQLAVNTLSSSSHQGSALFQNGVFGQNLQVMNSALTGQSNNLPNQNGGTQTNQFGELFNMFGGSPTSRWLGNNRFRGFGNAARMFG